MNGSRQLSIEQDINTPRFIIIVLFLELFYKEVTRLLVWDLEPFIRVNIVLTVPVNLTSKIIAINFVFLT